jgi:hypothetical protein
VYALYGLTPEEIKITRLASTTGGVAKNQIPVSSYSLFKLASGCGKPQNIRR